MNTIPLCSLGLHWFPTPAHPTTRCSCGMTSFAEVASDDDPTGNTHAHCTCGCKHTFTTQEIETLLGQQISE